MTIDWKAREALAKTLFAQIDMPEYADIIRIGEQTGLSIEHLTAQTYTNDPFYAQSPKNRQLAEWFVEHYQQINVGQPHIREAHYRFATKGFTLPNGETYENTTKCEMIMKNASSLARCMQLVSFEVLGDHKNDLAVVHMSQPNHEPEIELNSHEYEPDAPFYYTLSEPYSILDKNALQRYHLEVWIEKSGMNYILEPLVTRYGCVLQAFSGQASWYAVWKLYERAMQFGKPIRIFYISDHDPAGEDMPVAVASKIYWLFHEMKLDIEVKLLPIVLTPEQIAYYQLPPIPLKDTIVKTNRGKQYLAKHGGAVELNALEALYPGELERIVEEHILTYYDTDLWNEIDTYQDDKEDDFDDLKEDLDKKFVTTQEAIAKREVRIKKKQRHKERVLKQQRARVRETVADEVADLEEWIAELQRLLAEKKATIQPALNRIEGTEARMTMQTRHQLWSVEESRQHVIDQMKARYEKEMSGLELEYPEGKEVEDECDMLLDLQRSYYEHVIACREHTGKYSGEFYTYGTKKQGIGAKIAAQETYEQYEALRMDMVEHVKERLFVLTDDWQGKAMGIHKLEIGWLLLDAKALLPTKEFVALHKSLPLTHVQVVRYMQDAARATLGVGMANNHNTL